MLKYLFIYLPDQDEAILQYSFDRNTSLVVPRIGEGFMVDEYVYHVDDVVHSYSYEPGSGTPSQRVEVYLGYYT